MRALLTLAAALLASLALYLAVFSVVHRPMTMGNMALTLQNKKAHAQALPRPRLLVFAGSNGRYSHRCSSLTEATGLPCTNLSMAVGIGLDFQLDQFEPLLGPGDVLYLPLEYSQFQVSREEMDGGAQNAALMHELRAQLWQLPLPRIARVMSSFDLPFLVHGVLEMSLARTGLQRRGGQGGSLTPEGDARGHTAAASVPYQAFLRQTRFDPRPLPLSSHALDVLDAFLARAKARGVAVYGGLPTTPAHVVLDEAGIARLQQLYQRHGFGFIQLPQRSQYPLSCFHDTLYHLNEECQVAHSLAVGRALVQARAVLSGDE
jgi:hypothetical protein